MFRHGLIFLLEIKLQPTLGTLKCKFVCMGMCFSISGGKVEFGLKFGFAVGGCARGVKFLMFTGIIVHFFHDVGNWCLGW